MAQATAADVLQILDRHASDVVQRLRLPLRQVQLSMPMDDREPRIRVSVRSDSHLRVPKTLSFDLGGRKVRVPLERAHDFQDYKLH
jgi:hypothetical protein